MDIVIIEWHGPFCEEDEVKHIDVFKNGIYAFFGTEKYARHNDIILQYIGKTQNSFYKRWSEHTIPNEIRDNFSAWFGLISNKKKFTLNDIEHNFIYFCKPRLNDKCTVTLPKEKMIFISEFYKGYTDEKYIRSPNYLKYIPDFIMWDGSCLRLSQTIKTIEKSEL